MATHEIGVDLPAHHIVNADLRVVVTSDGRRLGELLISRGSLDWHPARRHSIVSLEWEAFATLMERKSAGEI